MQPHHIRTFHKHCSNAFALFILFLFLLQLIMNAFYRPYFFSYALLQQHKLAHNAHSGLVSGSYPQVHPGITKMGIDINQYLGRVGHY